MKPYRIAHHREGIPWRNIPLEDFANQFILDSKILVLLILISRTLSPSPNGIFGPSYKMFSNVLCRLSHTSTFLCVDGCVLLFCIAGLIIGIPWVHRPILFIWRVLVLKIILIDLVVQQYAQMQIEDFLMPIDLLWSSTIGIRFQVTVVLLVCLGCSIAIHYWWSSVQTGIDLSSYVRNGILQASYIGIFCLAVIYQIETYTSCSVFFTKIREDCCRGSLCTLNSKCSLNDMKYHLAQNHTNTHLDHMILPKEGRIQEDIGINRIVLFVIDSLPAREFLHGDPLSQKMTSKGFQEHLQRYMKGEKCHMLDRHFASSSYTNDAFFSMLHSVLPFGYFDSAPESFYFSTLKSYGWNISAFLNGEIGFDYCRSEERSDMHGMHFFDKIVVSSSDEDVEQNAFEWIQATKRKSFSIVYFEETHMTMSNPTLFEKRLTGVLERIKRIKSLLGNDSISFITSDHGCAVKNKDPVCPACFSHGFGVHGHHATDQVSHIPLWICRSHNMGKTQQVGFEKLVQSSTKKQITSSMDIMPTILHLITASKSRLDAMFSSGQSWLAHDNPSYCATFTRLKCEFSIGIINGTHVAYLDFTKNQMKCVQNRNLQDCHLNFRIESFQHNGIRPSNNTSMTKKTLLSYAHSRLVQPFLNRNQMNIIIE